MAERRMFAKTIVDSDAFIDMPVTARLLYYDLGMRADDDGFVNSPKKIMRMIGASEDDMRILVARKFIIPFETGIVVIKHWRIHNYIRKDRYVETKYGAEKAMLEFDENEAYTMISTDRQIMVDQRSTNGQPMVDPGKERLGKERLGKVREGKDSTVYFPNDEALNTAFVDYVAMRKKIKAPMTDRAIDLAIKKLESLSNGDNDVAIEILNQSVMNSWKGLFEVKKKPAKPGAINWDEV